MITFMMNYLLFTVPVKTEPDIFDLIYQSVIVVAALAFKPWLMYWNLIGFNY